MSIRSLPERVPGDPALAWADTLHALAERHRALRALSAASRWPLAHDCPIHRGRIVQQGATDPEPPSLGTVRHPFCCRALADRRAGAAARWSAIASRNRIAACHPQPGRPRAG
jgi:hypothetical protein